MCHVKRRQYLQVRWHLSSGFSTEILLRKSTTDLPPINAVKAKIDGSLRGKTRASPMASLSISGALCDSHVDRMHRAKYNSLSNVRLEDRQVGAFLRLFASPSPWFFRKDVTSSRDCRGRAFAKELYLGASGHYSKSIIVFSERINCIFKLNCLKCASFFRWNFIRYFFICREINLKKQTW